MKIPDNTLTEFDCRWDTEKGELVLGPHLKQRLNPEFSHSRGFTPIHGLRTDSNGKKVFVLSDVVFYTGCKDKGLILNNCPFCGKSLRPPNENEKRN